MADELLTLRQLAEQLNLSRTWLETEARGGRLPYLQAGHRRLFSVEAVRAELLRRANGDGQQQAEASP